MRRLRGNDVAMIFQDPLSSLHPFYKIGDQLVEAVQAHRDVSKAQALDRAVEMLGLVGIPEPRRRVDAYPHEFSGGMRQRVMIAMALINDPKLLIADEPTTALDVTVQAQILDLIQRLQRELDTAIVMITHDLGVVAEVADDIGVMYAGRIVEYADKDTIFAMPEHPYTWGLLKSIPRLDSPRGEELVPIPGRPPSLILKPPGLRLPPALPVRARGAQAHRPAARAGRRGRRRRRTGRLPAAGPDAPRAVGGAALGRHARRGATRVDVPDEAVDREAVGEVLAPEGTEVAPGVEGTGRDRGHGARRSHVVSTNGAAKLIEVRDLVKHFPLRQGIILPEAGRRRARRRRHLASTSSRARPSGSWASRAAASPRPRGCSRGCSSRPSGEIIYKGKDIAHSSRSELKPLRRDMQMIFQDPYSSLNPRKTVGSIIGEPFIIHELENDDDKRKKLVQELMDRVGLNPEHYNRFPHEFSGGQRQRIGVARAIALKPKLVVADEPVSALDVSIQAQIINLLSELQRELGLTIIFIAHDLSVVRHVCDRIAVMYLGKIVELADADQLFDHPRHPYTGALLSAVPVPDPRLAREKQRQVLGGDVPSPTNPPPACRFHTRCPKARDGRLQRRRAAARGQGGRQHRRLPLPADRRGDRRAGADRRGVSAARFENAQRVPGGHAHGGRRRGRDRLRGGGDLQVARLPRRRRAAADHRVGRQPRRRGALRRREGRRRLRARADRLRDRRRAALRPRRARSRRSSTRTCSPTRRCGPRRARRRRSSRSRPASWWRRTGGRVERVAPSATPRPRPRRLVVLGVERLVRELGAAAVEDLHVERVAAVVVGREEREAALEQRALVDREVGQLAGHHGAAVDERAAPHERHGGGLALLAAPGADDLVAEVDLPVGIGLGRLRREVGDGVEVGRLLAVAAGRVADVAEELVALSRSARRGHERAPVPRAVRVPGHLVGLAQVLALAVDPQARGQELLGQASATSGRRAGGPAAARRRSGGRSDLRVAWGRKATKLEQERHRAVVDQLDLHHRAEHAAAAPRRSAKRS